MSDPAQVRMLVTSMISSAYELNELIPNIELLFFKIFCSPITTAEQRKEDDKEDLLAGNIFAKKDINLGSIAYRSLLETVALYPKKKHFKKILDHMELYQDREGVDSDLIDLITFIGIENKYPILLGATMKHFL